MREKERGRVEEKCVMWELGMVSYVRLYGDVQKGGGYERARVGR